MRILLVDDSILIIERIEPMLQELNNIKQIDNASNYTEAVELLYKSNPDVVILDINMPGKNGLELLQLIKTEKPGTRVIMLSNHTNEFYQSLCSKIGADFFFDKSNDFELIPGAIASFEIKT